MNGLPSFGDKRVFTANRRESSPPTCSLTSYRKLSHSRQNRVLLFAFFEVGVVCLVLVFYTLLVSCAHLLCCFYFKSIVQRSMAIQNVYLKYNPCNDEVGSLIKAAD